MFPRADYPGQDIPRRLDQTQVRAHNLCLWMVVGELYRSNVGSSAQVKHAVEL